MTKEEYNKKCEELFELAKKKGLELYFEPDKFDCERLDCLWYGGNIATIKVNETVTVTIDAIGDVYATLFDDDKAIASVKDKSNYGAFYNEMAPHIKNDEELYELIESGKLAIGYNNWYEYDGLFSFGGKYEFVDLGIITDNVIDSNDLLEAIEEVIDNIAEISQDISTHAFYSIKDRFGYGDYDVVCGFNDAVILKLDNDWVQLYADGTATQLHLVARLDYDINAELDPIKNIDGLFLVDITCEVVDHEGIHQFWFNLVE